MAEPIGDCYTAAWELQWTLWKAGINADLCHGTVVGTGGEVLGKRFGHAWVEFDESEFVVEVANGNNAAVPRPIYYQAGQVENVVRYDAQTALRTLLEHGHYGPWHDDGTEL